MKDTIQSRRGHCLRYIIIMGLTLVTCLMVILGAVKVAMSGGSNDVSSQAGLSMACQGPRSIGEMTETAEIVTSALVVDVSPARDNVYAVTLQVSGNIVMMIGVKLLKLCLFLSMKNDKNYV